MSSMLEDLLARHPKARSRVAHNLLVGDTLQGLGLPQPMPVQAQPVTKQVRHYPDAAHRNSRPIRLKPSTITVDMDPTSKKG
jgi:hypothetical protein